MGKVIASFILFLTIIAASVLSMIYGWGLKPKSWGWIIGGYVYVSVVSGVAGSLSNGERK